MVNVVNFIVWENVYNVNGFWIHFHIHIWKKKRFWHFISTLANYVRIWKDRLRSEHIMLCVYITIYNLYHFSIRVWLFSDQVLRFDALQHCNVIQVYPPWSPARWGILSVTILCVRKQEFAPLTICSVWRHSLTKFIRRIVLESNAMVSFLQVNSYPKIIRKYIKRSINMYE